MQFLYFGVRLLEYVRDESQQVVSIYPLKSDQRETGATGKLLPDGYAEIPEALECQGAPRFPVPMNKQRGET